MLCKSIFYFLNDELWNEKETMPYVIRIIFIDNMTVSPQEDESVEHSPTQTVISWTGSLDSGYGGNCYAAYPPVGLGPWVD